MKFSPYIICLLGCKEFHEGHHINVQALSSYLQNVKQYTDEYGTVTISDAATAHKLISSRGCCGIKVLGKHICLTDNPYENPTLTENSLQSIAKKQFDEKFSLPEVIGNKNVVPLFCGACWRKHHIIAAYGLHQLIGLGTWMIADRFLQGQQNDYYLECECKTDVELSSSVKKQKNRHSKFPRPMRITMSLFSIYIHGKGDHKGMKMPYVKVRASNQIFMRLISSPHKCHHMAPLMSSKMSPKKCRLKNLSSSFLGTSLNTWISFQCQVIGMASDTIITFKWSAQKYAATCHWTKFLGKFKFWCCST